MDVKTSFFNIALLGLLSLPCPVMAQVNPLPEVPALHFRGMYMLSFDGLALGKMGVEVNETPHQYTMTSDVMTIGLVKMFVKHSSHTTVSGSGSEDFLYPTQKYESHYQTKGKKKYVRMITKDGMLSEDTLVPPDNPATRPSVDFARTQGAADPLSMLLRMREAVWKAAHNNTAHFSIPLYDGRRLTEVDFTMEGKKTLHMNGDDIPVISVMLARKQLAGFTTSEQSDFNPNEPPAHFFFSDDAKFVPLKAETSQWMGTVAATLIKECGEGESCLLGITE